MQFGLKLIVSLTFQSQTEFYKIYSSPIEIECKFSRVMIKDGYTQLRPCTGASFRYIKQVIYSRETPKSKHNRASRSQCATRLRRRVIKMHIFIHLAIVEMCTNGGNYNFHTLQ